jgi:hypothetical protein
MNKILLGQRVKDKLTGFEGLVTGRAQYITGCDQLLVQPSLNGKGEFVEARWLDEPRLDITESSQVMINMTSDKGGDKAAPIR